MRTFSLLVISFAIMCSADAQVVDRAPSGYKKHRAVEGGSEMVKIDTITPLPQLIHRLTKKWQFIETGKAYWIGYTDDMYSIANYSDKAIEPLVDFIDTAHSLEAKIGALYTLHLIGINLTIVGRFVEDFENKNARNALLKYLNDSELNETVVYLIMRDPWLSDVPKLMNYLTLPDRDYSKVLSALRRYKVPDSPLGQSIPDSIFQKNLTIKTPGNQGMKPMYALITFQKELAPNFVVDTAVSNSMEWKAALKELSLAGETPAQTTSVVFFLFADDIFSYTSFNDSFYYSFDDHIVKIYGPKKVRQMWLNWWKELPLDQKGKLLSSDHVSFNQRK